MARSRDHKTLKVHSAIVNRSFADACRCADRQREQESDEQAARRMRMPVGLVRHLRERKQEA